MSYESATGYNSAIKGYLENKFILHNPRLPPSYLPARYRVLRGDMYRKFVERHRKDGTFLVTPHPASSQSDRRSIALASIWDNTVTSAEFWNINNGMHHFVGKYLILRLKQVYYIIDYLTLYLLCSTF